MKRQRIHHRSVPLAAMLTIGLAASAPASSAQDRGVCVTAEVPEAFRLPDGSVHAAGRLGICTHRALNPVTALHRVWVDDDGASLAMSRRAVAEEYTDSRPVFLFRRASDGTLDLIGYVVPFDHTSWNYALKRSAAQGFAEPKETLAAAEATGSVVTLIATNTTD
jgi:hypothetical protein